MRSRSNGDDRRGGASSRVSIHDRYLMHTSVRQGLRLRRMLEITSLMFSRCVQPGAHRVWAILLEISTISTRETCTSRGNYFSVYAKSPMHSPNLIGNDKSGSVEKSREKADLDRFWPLYRKLQYRPSITILSPFSRFSGGRNQSCRKAAIGSSLVARIAGTAAAAIAIAASTAQAANIAIGS